MNKIRKLLFEWLFHLLYPWGKMKKKENTNPYSGVLIMREISP